MPRAGSTFAEEDWEPVDASWGTLHLPVKEGSDGRLKELQTMAKKKKPHPPKETPKAICGFCLEEVDGIVNLCVPKDHRLRNLPLERMGPHHGRVHSECAFPQLLAMAINRGQSARFREHTRRLGRVRLVFKQRTFALCRDLFEQSDIRTRHTDRHRRPGGRHTD